MFYLHMILYKIDKRIFVPKVVVTFPELMQLRI